MRYTLTGISRSNVSHGASAPLNTIPGGKAGNTKKEDTMRYQKKQFSKADKAVYYQDLRKEHHIFRELDHRRKEGA